MNDKYKAYLLSKEWMEVKIDLLQLRGCKCEKCKSVKPANKLQIHHKTYVRIFNEKPSDLIILCARCHMKQHKDIVPNKVLKSFGIIKKKRVKKKSATPKKRKVPKKKKLTTYQKALIHFSKK